MFTFPSLFCFFNTNPESFKCFQTAEGHLVPVPCLALSSPTTHAEVCLLPLSQAGSRHSGQVFEDILFSGGWGTKLISFTISILNPDLYLLTSSEINPQTKAADHTVSSSSSQTKSGSTLGKSVFFVFYHFPQIVSSLLLSEVHILFTQMEVRQDCLWPASPLFLRSWCFRFHCLYVNMNMTRTEQERQIGESDTVSFIIFQFGKSL